MKLTYLDQFNGKHIFNMFRIGTQAKITTDHPASSYGIPVVVLPNGEVIDMISWTTLNYKVVKATKKERELLDKLFNNWINLIFKGGIEK